MAAKFTVGVRTLSPEIKTLWYSKDKELEPCKPLGVFSFQLNERLDMRQLIFIDCAREAFIAASSDRVRVRAAVMHFYDADSYESIAADMGVSVETARNRATQGLEDLRRHFRKKGIFYRDVFA